MVKLTIDKPNKAPAWLQPPGARPKGREPLSNSESTKLCGGCNKVLPLCSFSRKGPGKLQTRCKDCANAWVKQYRIENPEKQKEADRRYVKNHREEVRERQRRYRQANAEQLAAKILVWKQANPGRVREILARARAKRFGVVGFVSDTEFQALCERYGNRCLCCGRADVKLTWDHVVPLSKGGPHHISNIQPLCSSCNGRKSDDDTDYREDSFVFGS